VSTSPPRIIVSAAQAYPVSAVATAISRLLARAPAGWVEGEIRQINVHAKSGHCYLVLADDEASLDAIIWRSDVSNCRPLPEVGDLVQAHYSKINFYLRRGSTSLIIDEIKAVGDGELLRRREDVLARLRTDGLCDVDRRKPLPTFPRRIGVIAGQNTEAQTDVIAALRERRRSQDIVFASALVQGLDAPNSIIDALGRLQDHPGVDVIVLARGGGSVEDLSPFDDERLCRAIFACALPVITSIGHTRDHPNCDYVAAAYSPVPALAAELAISHSDEELLSAIAECVNVSTRAIETEIDALAGSTEAMRETLRETPKLHDYEIEIERVRAVISARSYLLFERSQNRFSKLDSQLKALLLACVRQLPSALALGLHTERLRAANASARAQIHAYGRALTRIHQTQRHEIHRHLALAHERVQQAEALLKAKDVRAFGYALLTNDEGTIIKTVAALHAGDSLKLTLIDGEADTVISSVKEQTQ
jgi:exodeoxyribonuclease VII large subunit